MLASNRLDESYVHIERLMVWIFISVALLLIAWYFLQPEWNKVGNEVDGEANNELDIFVLPEQFIVFDLETTGLNAEKDEILEIGAIKVNRDSLYHDTFQALIKPSKKIPRKITRITGITQKMIEAEGEEIGYILDEFVKFIGDLRLVAFNADFDMSFLQQAAKRHGIKINNRVSCALKMARRAWPGLKSYKLIDLAKMGKLSTKGNHRALKDCELTIKIYFAVASELGSVR